jgi:hypothetical protein
VSAGLDQAARI